MLYTVLIATAAVRSLSDAFPQTLHGYSTAATVFRRLRNLLFDAIHVSGDAGNNFSMRFTFPATPEVTFRCDLRFRRRRK
jgi:hypothetical protein